MSWQKTPLRILHTCTAVYNYGLHLSKEASGMLRWCGARPATREAGAANPANKAHCELSVECEDM